jgi:CPA1 family monovalent cation:H+ antiporter
VNLSVIFVILFAIAAAVAVVARRVRVPYTVALLVVGVLLGSFSNLPVPALTKELLFAVFLPGLLFEAAFHLRFSDFHRNWLTISSLAVPGVIASTALTALLFVPAAQLLGVVAAPDWRPAIVFGALIAATDPIAVVALFRSLGAPRRLTVLVEGESLLNDGTAVVFFTLALHLSTGQTTSAVALVAEFLRVAGGGVAIGALLGWVISLVISRLDDAMVEITLTTVAAYGSFVFAEQLHMSGVIATVAAGLMCGNVAAGRGMSESTRVAMANFWSYVAFALNSVVFLLLGYQVTHAAVLSAWAAILIAYLSVTVGRGIVIGVVSMLLKPSTEALPRGWPTVLAWGGLRGALSLVLALSLPVDFPARDLVIAMTAGVVALSIVVQGVTIAPLVKRLGLVSAAGDPLAADGAAESQNAYRAES